MGRRRMAWVSWPQHRAGLWLPPRLGCPLLASLAPDHQGSSLTQLQAWGHHTGEGAEAEVVLEPGLARMTGQGLKSEDENISSSMALGQEPWASGWPSGAGV